MHDSQWRIVRSKYKTLEVKFPTVSALNEFYKKVPPCDKKVDNPNILEIMKIISSTFGVSIAEHEDEYEEDL